MGQQLESELLLVTLKQNKGAVRLRSLQHPPAQVLPVPGTPLRVQRTNISCILLLTSVSSVFLFKRRNSEVELGLQFRTLRRSLKNCPGVCVRHSGDTTCSNQILPQPLLSVPSRSCYLLPSLLSAAFSPKGICAVLGFWLWVGIQWRSCPAVQRNRSRTEVQSQNKPTPQVLIP